MNKPHIRRRFGIWTCVTLSPFMCGCGYTVREACSDWQRIASEVAA